MLQSYLNLSAVHYFKLKQQFSFYIALLMVSE